MNNRDTADYYAALNTVFGAIGAVHNEDRDRVQSLLEGLDLSNFIIASLGISELVLSNMADALGLPFDALLDDVRGKVLALEHGEDA